MNPPAPPAKQPAHGIPSTKGEERPCRYEELAHTAEVGLHIQAPTPAALFSCAATGMMSLLQAGPTPASRHYPISLTAVDTESLLVDWLNELLYLHETTGDVFTGFEITSWQPDRLEAVATGGSPARPPRLHIKAVTYHQLHVTQTAVGWTADVFFDI